MMETQTATFKKTRATVIRESVKLRIATSEDGPRLEALFKMNNVVFPLANWETVSPHWLIATVDDEVIGCLLVVTARPVGLLEFLLVKPTVKFKLRAIAMQKLALLGATTLREYGCAYLSCIVVAENKPFFDVLKKYGFMEAAPATVMVKRLKD